MIAAAIQALSVLGQEEPFGYLVGDVGSGEGSQKLYQYLAQEMKDASFQTVIFHYLQPHIGWHSRILSMLQKKHPRPILIADAGFMYIAKMSGRSSAYDLFTPDLGELAFLADELAPHPFYTRGFLLYEESRVPDLIARAYQHGNAARYLLVKGKKDYVANKDGIQAIIDSPMEEALEAIGGTGDTLTGLVGALVDSGIELGRAAVLAARVNRWVATMPSPLSGPRLATLSHISPKPSKGY